MNTTTNTLGVSEAMVAELIAAGDFLAMNGTDGMVRRWEKAKAALSAPEPAKVAPADVGRAIIAGKKDGVYPRASVVRAALEDKAREQPVRNADELLVSAWKRGFTTACNEWPGPIPRGWDSPELDAEARAYAAVLLNEPSGNSGQLPAAWIIRKRNTHPMDSIPRCTTHEGDAADHIERGDDVIPLYTALSAQPAERVPEGWVLVPRELDAEMLDVAIETHLGFTGEDEVDELWAALIAASPAPSESEGGKGVDDTFARELYIASQCDAHNLHTLAWHELTEKQRDEWRKKATGAAR